MVGDNIMGDMQIVATYWAGRFRRRDGADQDQRTRLTFFIDGVGGEPAATSRFAHRPPDAAVLKPRPAPALS
jgi:hypothetical protein